jgi:ATP-binding cassette subfamily B multidrug efflux pump
MSGSGNGALDAAGRLAGGRQVAAVFADVARAHPALAAALLATVAATVVTALLPPLVLARVVDGIAAGSLDAPGLAAAYLALVVLEGIAGAGQEAAIAVFGQKVTHELRSRMAAKLDRLPAGYFVRNAAGAITSRLVNDVDAVEALFASGVVGMAADVCQVVGIVCVVTWESVGLGLMLLVALPLVFLFTRHVQRATLDAQTQNRVAVGEANEQIPETLRTIRTIRQLGREAFMGRRYARAIDRAFQAQERSNFYDAVYSPVVITTSSVVIGVSLSLAAQGGALGSLFGVTVGGAVAVISYVEKVFTPLSDIGMEIQSIQQAAAGVRRIGELLGEAEERPVADCGPVDAGDGAAAVLSHVTFGYEPGSPVLRDFSLRVGRGERVTLVGRTGAGKSTVLRLLLGLYQPDAGEVTVLGRRAGAIPAAERRRSYGYVEQAFRAVPGSVADQVSLGDPSVSAGQVSRALGTVGLLDVVEGLPDGASTPFADARLSQGQLQLLNIARAIVCDPSLLFLDEVTANLDSATERQVMDALSAAVRGRTVISVSHRLFEQEGGRLVRVGEDAGEGA